MFSNLWCFTVRILCFTTSGVLLDISFHSPSLSLSLDKWKVERERERERIPMIYYSNTICKVFFSVYLDGAEA